MEASNRGLHGLWRPYKRLALAKEIEIFPGGSGRVLALPPQAQPAPDRGCVVLDQPQHVARAGRIGYVPKARLAKLLRLIPHGAGHSRAPGAVWSRARR